MSEAMMSKGSSAKVLWAIATSPYPLTVKQITERLGYDPTSRMDRKAVGTAVRRLHETGLLARRQVPGSGAPYEYIVDPEWDPEGQA